MRIRIRHIEKRGNATIGRGTALALYVCLFGQPRITEMYMLVYHAGQNETPRGIYFFIVVSTGSILAFLNPGYLLALYHD